MDLDVRIALTNAYRHLFYPANDPVKAPKGLMHYPLPAQDASTVKGNRNQQDVVLKALKDCGKVRSEDAAPYAPAYLLQKVWPTGLDHWTTKSLREQFAKDLALNMLLDAEVSKLRDTIRKGLTEGQWDLKVGEQLYIKTDGAPVGTPTTIEFSERAELYRRGLLKPPEPKVVELSAQLLAGGGDERTVQVRWRAKEALKVSLYQDGSLVGDEFLPSDEHQGQIAKTTQFKVVADYGTGEMGEAVQTVVLYPAGNDKSINGGEGNGGYETLSLLNKPTEKDFEGSPTKIFNDLADWLGDYQPQAIAALGFSVSDVTDYRKLGTTLPLLARYQFDIEQFVTVQTGQQFVRLEYQGDVRGFQSFFSTLNGMLNLPETQASLTLTVRLKLNAPMAPGGAEIQGLQQALTRNPVDRMNLRVRVEY